MLVMLLPEQVSRNWDEIKGYLEEATPGTDVSGSDRMNNILEDILVNRKKIWISYNENREFDGLVGTEVYLDRINSIKTLEIFTIWAKPVIGEREGIREKSWEDGLNTLFKHAESMKCKRVVAYTSKRELVERAKSLGFDTSFTVCDLTFRN